MLRKTIATVSPSAPAMAFDGFVTCRFAASQTATAGVGDGVAVEATATGLDGAAWADDVAVAEGDGGVVALVNEAAGATLAGAGAPENSATAAHTAPPATATAASEAAVTASARCTRCSICSIRCRTGRRPSWSHSRASNTGIQSEHEKAAEVLDRVACLARLPGPNCRRARYQTARVHALRQALVEVVERGCPHRMAWAHRLVVHGYRQENRANLPRPRRALSLEYYGRPGFVTREYEHGGYGFVTRDGSTKGSSLIPTANQTQARRGRDASALENPSGREVERFPRRYRRLPQQRGRAPGRCRR